MSAPFSPAPLGTPDAWREMIAEAAEGAFMEAQMIRDCVYMRNDAGTNHHLKRVAAFVGTRISAAASLKEMKAEEAQRRLGERV